MVQSAVRIVAGLALTALVGCGSSAPPGSTLTAAATSSASDASPFGRPATSITPPPSGSDSEGTPTDMAGVVADPSLLDVVPRAGLTLTYDGDSTAEVAADPTLAESVSALAIGLVVPGGVSASAAPGEDIAVVSVIRVRPVGRHEEWFRSYRDSYDEAACANAGGVTRHAQTEIGATTVFVGSCAGGSFTYHGRVGDDIVLSLTSIGPTHLGRTIMEGLAP